MTREYRKTEKAIRAEFWATIAPGIPANDKLMLRQAFNDWTDSLERDGRLTEYQASRITLGPETPLAARATAAELRRALGDLLADVSDGTVKNGGNPWGLESVKAASFALTGDRFGFSGGAWKAGRK